MTPILAKELTDSIEITLSTERPEDRHHYVLVKSCLIANKYFFSPWQRSLVLSLIPISQGFMSLFPPGLFPLNSVC